MSQIITLARYILLEALRTRFFIIILVIVSIGMGIALFLEQISLTESHIIQSSVLAGYLRFSSVYAISLFVISSMVREFQDRSLHLWLAFPIARSQYFFGKLLGFFLLAILLSLILLVVLLTYELHWQTLLWGFSLCCELFIIISFSLLCVVSFQQTVPALSAVIGFYLLARSIGTVQTMSYSLLHNSTTTFDRLLHSISDILTMLLPHLDEFTRSDWLVYHTGSWEQLTAIFTQTLIYLSLLILMSLFDLYRKEIH